MHGAAGFAATVLIRVLEALFAVGVVGSALVIILSSIEDARTLTNRDADDQTAHDREGADSLPSGVTPQE